MGAHGMPAPQPMEPQFGRTHRLVLALAILAAIAVAGAAGWLGGGLLQSRSAPAPVTVDRLAAVGPLQLAVDSGLEPVSATAELAGTGLRDLTVFAPVAGLPGRIWIGRGEADDATLVPAAVRARLVGDLPPHADVSLAGRPAWSYGSLSLRDGGLLELTVQPTSAGVLIVGCQAELAVWSTVSGCVRRVQIVSGAATAAPAADLVFQQRLGPVLDRLNARRAAGAKALARARTAAGQRRSALTLARAHTQAARALAPSAGQPGAPKAVVARLRNIAAAYGALAGAAQRASRVRYARARARAARAEKALQVALARVGR
jgi:hypothetical protein